MFKKTSDVFLALSIVMSVKTICFVTLKAISIVKPFLPFTSKMVLLSWIIVSASTRVMTNVLFFTPAFGFFSILGHLANNTNQEIQDLIESGFSLAFVAFPTALAQLPAPPVCRVCCPLLLPLLLLPLVLLL